MCYFLKQAFLKRYFIRFIGAINTRIKIVGSFQKCWSLETFSAFRSRFNTKGKLEQPNICQSKYKKKIMKIRAILFNWMTTDRMVTGFSFNNRPKGSENMPG